MAKTRTPRPAPIAHAPPRPKPRRRWLWKAIAGAILPVAAWAGWWFWPREARLEVVHTLDQNVLVVTIDTLRADALGSYGGSYGDRAATPNLDRLAGDGIRYDYAHAHAVLTLPSHVSILSGQYPFQHGVRDNSGYRVSPTTATLATLLETHGYATGAFVGAFPLDSQFGLDAGFGTYDDRLNEVKGPADFAFSERPADVVVGAALTWLQAQPDRKWFLWVHLYDPHEPTAPPEPFKTQYADYPYAGEVAFVDAALGPLFAHVRGLNTRPTLVIVTSDHGEGQGDHGEDTHGVFAYEATLRVPLIVAQYAVGASTAGTPPRRPRVSALAAQHVDVLPTVMDALTLPAPADLPGRSLFALDTTSAAARSSYFEALAPALNRGWAPLYGVMAGRDKFVDLPIPELYDLGADPQELHNLVESQPEKRRAIEARLKAFGPIRAGRRQAENAETAARLRSLGYTSGSAAVARNYTEDDDPKRLIALDQALHRGIVLFHQGQVREAADVYRSIVLRRPGMAIAYLHLAFLEWTQGETARAIATLRSARTSAGESAEIDAQLGMYLSETGDAKEALPLLERAVGRADAGSDTLNALGITYARLGQGSKALDTFEKILKIDPRNAMAVQNIGSVYLSAGNLTAAAKSFEQAIAVNPGWAAAYTGLGVVRLRTGDRSGAIAAWAKAVELNPSDFDALFNLATELVNDRRFAEARPYLERFVSTAPPAFYGDDIARLKAILAHSSPPR